MNTKSTFCNFGGIVAMALVVAMGPLTISAQSNDSEDISKLLVEAKSYAALALDDAGALESFTTTDLNWRAHGFKLEEIRRHVNALGKVSRQLSDLRSFGSPWQQSAVDEIEPLLQDMANQLTVTINHLNENHANIQFKEYRDHAHANYELARTTSEKIRDFVDYDLAKAKADALESKLELPTVDNSE